MFNPQVSGALQALTPDQLGNLAVTNVKFPEKGYLYVYVCDESAMDVYFDNLQIIHYTNPLTEVNDYYPFGLLAKTSTSLGGKPQNYKYNGKELQKDLAFNVEDYGARQYDPVSGRWLQVDPLAEKYRRWSPYNYAVDNPVRFIDPDGNRIEDSKGRNMVFINKNGEIKFTKFASSDVKLLVSNMARTKIGSKVAKDMIKVKYGITMQIDKSEGATYYDSKTKQQSKEANESSKIMTGFTLTSKDQNNNITKVDVTLYEGSINKAMKEGLGFNLGEGDKKNYYKTSDYSKDENIGAVGTHEGTHPTDKKSMRAFDASDPEKNPSINQKKYFDEINESKAE